MACRALILTKPSYLPKIYNIQNVVKDTLSIWVIRNFLLLVEVYMAHPIFAPEPRVGFVEKITK
jgi:hypothetical protein